MLDNVVQQSGIINMALNALNSVSMVFTPRDWPKVIMSSFPEFCANGETSQYVSSFKYLGHISSINDNDDADIQREILSMFNRMNILPCKFHKCSIAVKSLLFRSYCICLRDAALWSKFHVGILKLWSSYNRCIKIFFGF